MAYGKRWWAAAVMVLAIWVVPAPAFAVMDCPSLIGTRDGTGTGDGAPVPGVTGMTLSEASTALREAGFRPQPDPADAAAEWKVTSQSPVADERASCASDVQIVLLSDPVTVPDVVGQSQEDAAATLEDAGLVAEVGDGDGEAAEPSEVIAQDPAAGATVNEGDTVQITLRLATPTPVVTPIVTPVVTPVVTPDVTDEITPEPSSIGERTPEAIVPDERSSFVPVAGVGVGVGLIVLLLLGWLLLRLLKPKAKRPPVEAVVHCVAYPDLAPYVELVEIDIRIDMHQDPGHQELWEARR